MKELFVSYPYLFVFVMAFFNWFMTFLGSTIVFFIKKESQKLVSIALGSAAGIMVAASFFSLILPAINELDNKPTYFLFIILLGFLLGGLFLRLCDLLLPHEHLISHHQEGLKDSHLSKTNLLMLAMTLHNIPEGLAVGVAFAGNGQQLLSAIILSIGIGIQNFPEGMAISLPMHQCGISKSKSLFYGQLSALVEIPSALIGYSFAKMMGTILPFALSFAAGAMIFVCIEELIPEANATKEIDVGTMSFMVGFIIMMTLDICLG